MRVRIDIRLGKSDGIGPNIDVSVGSGPPGDPPWFEFVIGRVVAVNDARGIGGRFRLFPTMKGKP